MLKTTFLIALMALTWAKTTFAQKSYTGFRGWVYSSPPPDQLQGFTQGLETNFNRAHLSWYIIDPSFYFGPSHLDIPEASLFDHYSRQITPSEVFPLATNIVGDNYLKSFNLRYLPQRPGPYNYETLPTTISAGIDAEGNLQAPETRWAGMMRWFADPDLPAQGIDSIDFWLLDPFIDNPDHEGLTLTFQIGDISEDVLIDNISQVEQGLVGNLDSTVWGPYPLVRPPFGPFTEVEGLRNQLDVGLDGLSDEQEREWYESNYLQPIANVFGQSSLAYQKAWADPSHDNFRLYDDPSYEETPITDRYLEVNGMEGNSRIMAPVSGMNNFTSYPDQEDLNLNRVMETREMTEDYVLVLKPGMQDAAPFIVEEHQTEVRLVNGTVDNVTWYHFQIPLVKAGSNLSLDDFREVMGTRLVLSDAHEPVTLRFVQSRILNCYERGAELFLGNVTSPVTPYPNPFRETLNFQVSDRDEWPARLQLWDTRGRKVEDYAFAQFSKSYTEADRLSPGIYFYELTTCHAIHGRSNTYQGKTVKLR